MALRRSTLAIFALAALSTAPAIAIAADTQSKVQVIVNMARILRLPSDASTVVIGNPGIADAVIQDPRTLVLTGKGFGSTNLIALDSVGNPIADLIVRVGSDGDDLVTVFQGTSKTSMSCTPHCQPMAIGGDHPDFVDQVVQSHAAAATVGQTN